MAVNIDKLQTDATSADEKAAKLQAEKDDAVAKARNRYTERIQKANQDAADAQKRLNDAQAVEALRDRPDAAAVARAVNLYDLAVEAGVVVEPSDDQ